MRTVVEEVFKMHAVECNVGIAPSADFRPGRLFPSSTMKNCAFGNNCWAVRNISDYCILQHRHRGCYLFVGGSSPERSKFVSELARFTLVVIK